MHVSTVLRDFFVSTEISTEEQLSAAQEDGAAFQVFLLCKRSSVNTQLPFPAGAQRRQAPLPEEAKHFRLRSSLCLCLCPRGHRSSMEKMGFQNTPLKEAVI